MIKYKRLNLLFIFLPILYVIYFILYNNIDFVNNNCILITGVFNAIILIKLLFILPNNKNKSLIFFLLLIIQIISIIFKNQYLIIIFIVLLESYIIYEEKRIIKNKNKLIGKKITIYVKDLLYGNIQNSVCNKANMLTKKFNVEIVSLYYNKPFYKLEKKVDIKYLTRLSNNKEKLLFNIKHFKLLKVLIETFKIIKTNIIIRINLNKSLIKCDSEYIIITSFKILKRLIKNNEYNNIKIFEEYEHINNKNYIKSTKKFFEYIDYIMPSTDYYTNFYKDTLNNSDRILTNHISVETNNVICDINKKNILTIENIEKEFNFKELIDAFQKINNKEWTLTIVGNGTYYDKLRKLISSNNLDSIKLVNFKSNKDLIELYNSSSIYIMANNKEEFNLNLIEAASHGLSIVSYKNSITNNLLGENGLLVDNINDMTNVLEKLINDSNERKYYQSKSLRLYNKYNYDIISDYNLDLYKRMEKKELYRTVYNGTREKCYKDIDKLLKEEKKKFIITANSETFMLAKKDKDLYNMVYDRNNMVVPDGIFIVKTAKLLNKEIKERITGIDLAEHLLEIANKKKYKVYLFGATEKVMTKLTKVIEEKYPGIILVGSTNGFIKNKDIVMDYVKETEPDIIMVALGIPLQEKLIYKHLDKFKKGVFIGLGGSFDVISGSKKRAPKIFIKTNLEWLYRIMLEPRRIGRFINYNLKFILLIIKEKYKK